ncbi:alkylphosphonate utilization protein [Vibrio anguillarum]|uniref:Alkylphosphonate utilization protein n=4 Tax=Vibrio TaxID=662 RepID=A0A241PK00_VIBAN|nr:DNA gyrase subunit A [Vibrio anguillarum 775]AGU59085.1 alkylphosphonate utilization protein [Vibrio anguillarum M3]ASF93759.1 alkylphosphonate utilization protein [Vibrio anguillarum]NAW89497.1 alkylphosphonate utilization protein [Vibrio sp. V24_P1S3T111]NAW96963.1 alkylphosphonate utilization protein [Vibrio sp. V23_P3S9T160]NAX16917.1 alkylphosphonate utilization protein [Vibrio sp. V22_P2S10T140]NAX43123.1 alkylphosphonate utilization protein [Vibrio sp. V25_P4S6T154]NNN47469.1 alkyl
MGTMSTEATLLERSQSKCELCSSESPLAPFVVAPHTMVTVDHAVMLCDVCKGQIENPETVDVNHWRCLNDSMWSQEQPVQVLAWRQLKRLAATEGWAQDLLDMMYLEEEAAKWAEIGMDDDAEKPRDVNGVELKKGDDVTIIKDLPIKGSSQVIKQGTVVRGISLSDDPKLISGKANGQSMYIIAEYCRKK